MGGDVSRLYHLTERGDWAAARTAGEYRISTRGVPLDHAGFIHLSSAHQLRGVAESVYPDAPDDVVLLVIDPERLADPVRYEAAEPGGERFPHLYGPLPAAAVVDVIPVPRSDGRLVPPDIGLEPGPAAG
jgi:uncharacterized protein (DUF952 family)